MLLDVCYCITLWTGEEVLVAWDRHSNLTSATGQFHLLPLMTGTWYCFAQTRPDFVGPENNGFRLQHQITSSGYEYVRAYHRTPYHTRLT